MLSIFVITKNTACRCVFLFLLRKSRIIRSFCALLTLGVAQIGQGLRPKARQNRRVVFRHPDACEKTLGTFAEHVFSMGHSLGNVAV